MATKYAGSKVMKKTIQLDASKRSGADRLRNTDVLNQSFNFSEVNKSKAATSPVRYKRKEADRKKDYILNTTQIRSQ